MAKILEQEFRKELYKNLVEAGYNKDEAQKIVGTKYYAELLQTVTHDVDLFLNSIVKETFDAEINFDDVKTKIEELKKLKEII